MTRSAATDAARAGQPPADELSTILSSTGLRTRLAGNPQTPAKLLTVLARDPVATVRGAVALNPAASITADQHLATDADERVRLLLTSKIVGQVAQHDKSAPQGWNGSGDVQQRAFAILETLVQDEAVRIRRLIAEELAHLPNSPHPMIVAPLLLALARDAVISVSEPVLRLSPLLTEDDLLALLETPPNAAAADAIARRNHLPEVVSDAIAASADDMVIRTLLANPSAAIREDTLDSLIGRAATQVAWHEPLVHRPSLPDHAARALSEIVAAHLMEVLAGRSDLGAETLLALQARVAHRLGEPASPPAHHEDQSLLEEARRLVRGGRLDERVLIDAARRGQARRTAVLLATAASVPLAIVDHAAALRSAKAFVSLVWRAGFTMDAAVAVQSLLGQLAPAAILVGVPGQAFPLGQEEMTWQLGFLGVKSQ